MAVSETIAWRQSSPSLDDILKTVSQYTEVIQYYRKTKNVEFVELVLSTEDKYEGYPQLYSVQVDIQYQNKE